MDNERQLLVSGEGQVQGGKKLEMIYFFHKKQRHVNVIWQDMELMSRREKR